jgi:ketosteroid isomerase-like protein
MLIQDRITRSIEIDIGKCCRKYKAGGIMSNVEVITEYFKTFFSGKGRQTEVRNFLTEDFTFRGPLMSASSADDYVNQLAAMGDEIELYATVRELVADGDIVAALVDFQGPDGPITYTQWFTLRDEKIARLEVVYDPRPFLNRNASD